MRQANVIEPIKQHILGISTFVRKRRLQVGLTDEFSLLTPTSSPNPGVTANGQRGSYRFLPTPDKRSRTDYTGLDGPSRKKKRNKFKINDKNLVKEIVHENHDVMSSQKGDTSVNPPLTPEAYAPITSSPHTKTTLPINMGTPRAEHLPDTIIENILINCVKLNDPLGRYGHRATKTTMTTSIERIQGFVSNIIGLQYQDAVQAIKQENAFFASKSIQARFNETVYWEIIQKGAALLDPKDLPTSKGPLDEFTMAEKIAAQRFMMEAGYGLSLANQRQRRLFWKRLFEMRNAGSTRSFCTAQRNLIASAKAIRQKMGHLW